MAAHRPMTVAEKYYTFLDHRWRSNVLISADLDICPEPSVVLDAWRRFRRRRVLARAFPTLDLTLVDPGDDVELHGDLFASLDLPADSWDRVFDEESVVAYDLSLPMRCRYLTSRDEGRSRIILVGHHSLLDGRIGLTEVQAFVRHLGGQEIDEQQELSIPAAPRADLPWQQSARARLDLLRELKARAVEIGSPGPSTWPPVDQPRRPRLRQLVVDPDLASEVLATGRAHGSSAFSTVAAGWMATVADELCPDADAPAIQLAAPADLSTPSSDSSRPPAMSVAVLSHPYRLDRDDPWRCAVEVLGTVRAALERGEGELFFQLTRAGAAEDIDEGAALVGAGLAAGPPTVVVSNMGVVDPGSDPEWVRHVQGQLAPSPNQMVFAATLSYRGQFLHTISTDDLRIPAERSAAMITAYLDRLRSMTGR